MLMVYLDFVAAGYDHRWVGGQGHTWFKSYQRRSPKKRQHDIPAYRACAARFQPGHDARLMERMFTRQGDNDAFVGIFRLIVELLFTDCTIFFQKRGYRRINTGGMQWYESHPLTSFGEHFPRQISHDLLRSGHRTVCVVILH